MPVIFSASAAFSSSCATALDKDYHDYHDYCDYCDYRDYRDRDRILTKPTSETRGGVACGRCSASCVQAMSSEKVSVRFPKNTLYIEHTIMAGY